VGEAHEDLGALVAESETGARRPHGLAARVLLVTALGWSLFQLWYASPLPFLLGVFILNDTEARSIHLALSLFLAFLAYPAFRRSPRTRVPVSDWGFALVGAFCGGYLFLFYRALSARPGLPTGLDLVTAAIGLVLLLEAARRTLGPALPIIGLVFIGYIFLGPYLPDVMAHKGASLSRAMSQLWLTTEGVFGVALGVSTSFVFLFVLFGSLLERAGAGNYFVKLSFALLGHLRGGPAKAAVVSSGLTGVISGSSIANVVTTGTFTIPLMKRVGYPAVKAGAVEVAASVNGQLMPPVMGAAAFLIAEYVGISYVEVVKHAFLPAVITYLSLFYIVHLEAVKADLRGLPRAHSRPLAQTLAALGMTAAALVVLAALVYYGVGWLKIALGGAATWAIVAGLVLVYLALVRYRARFPDLELDDPRAAVVLPDAAETARTGLHFLLPVVVLIWCLMVEALSPGLSAFWATLMMIGILLTQRPLTAWFRGEADVRAAGAAGARDLLEGLVAGARNMVGIGVATAAAGIVVGTVTLTGVGLVMTELVDLLSGGNLLVMLLLTAVICLILGMGLPTTANYIVVATLMAPVVVELAAKNDLAVALVAVHLFVFYFGLMADVTPPVGLASFAASAISGASPIATGVQAFRYEIRTALLPFIFIFNHGLLLIGITSVWHGLLVGAVSLLAMLLFVAATQGHFLTGSRWYESAALLLVAFSLFRPGYWMDMVYEPYREVAAARVLAVAAAEPPEGYLHLRVAGETLAGREIEKTVRGPLGDPGEGAERLSRVGLTLRAADDGKVEIARVAFGSRARKLGLDAGWQVLGVEVPAERPRKEWMWLPALALLGLVIALQLGRRRR
jgi:TRAP transporter 4TM/12TM fusion protein